MARKKKEPWKAWISILAIVLIVSYLLRQETVSEKVAPTMPEKVRAIANVLFWLAIGGIMIAFAAGSALTGWVSIVLASIGGLIIVTQMLNIWEMTTKANPTNAP